MYGYCTICVVNNNYESANSKSRITQLNGWAFLQHTPEELLEYMAASDFQLVSQTDNDVIFVNNRLLGWLSEVAFCGGLGYLE